MSKIVYNIFFSSRESSCLKTCHQLFHLYLIFFMIILLNTCVPQFLHTFISHEIFKLVNLNYNKYFYYKNQKNKYIIILFELIFWVNLLFYFCNKYTFYNLSGEANCKLKSFIWRVKDYNVKDDKRVTTWKSIVTNPSSGQRKRIVRTICPVC